MSSFPKKLEAAYAIFPLYRFVKDNISLAPNNDAAWNYYRGILQHNKQRFSTQYKFVKMYAKEPDSDSDTDSEIALDLDNPAPGYRASLPCAAAVEFLAEIHEEDNTAESIQAAVLVSCMSIGRFQHLNYYESCITSLLSWMEFANRELAPRQLSPIDCFTFCRYWEYRASEAKALL